MNARPGAQEPFRARLADPGGSARDDCDSAVKTVHLGHLIASPVRVLLDENEPGRPGGCGPRSTMTRARGRTPWGGRGVYATGAGPAWTAVSTPALWMEGAMTG